MDQFVVWLLIAAYVFFKHVWIYYFVIGLPLFVLVGCIARSKRRSFIGWFVLSVVFSPVLALLALIAVPVRAERISLDPVRITPTL